MIRTIHCIAAFTTTWFCLPVALSTAATTDTLLVVVGAGGTEAYQSTFETAAESWAALGKARGWNVTLLNNPSLPNETSSSKSDAADSKIVTQKALLQQALESAKQDSPNRLWLVLIGHGTNGSGNAKFNLVGEDISANELTEILASYSAPLVVINCSSASGPFLPALSGKNRVIITATRNGGEINYSRFAQFLSDTLGAAEADLDHDDEVSLLEAFLVASRQTNQFYVEASRLATEHALLDDNGDSLGTSVDFYSGIKVAKSPKEGSVDGETASSINLASLPNAVKLSEEGLQKREQIEQQIRQLKSQKTTLESDVYWQRLEELMLKLSKIYARVE